LANRFKAAYENIPLPPGQATGLAVDFLLTRLRPWPLPGPRFLHGTAGLGLLLAGVGLNVWALAERRRRSAGPFELERPEELVTSGPYAFTRHPMYVGWWLLRLGAGISAGSAWVLATLPPEVLAEHHYILREEAQLAELFGRTYPDYAEKVPRYLRLPAMYRPVNGPGPRHP
jgi:protein-S-isoprenylcysteine O-methyltransferase Ste14